MSPETSRSSRTITTKRTYLGLELSSIDGPFIDDGSGSPPSDAPRTQLAHYGPVEVDACTLDDRPANRRRLKTSTRFVTSTRTLVTTYCNHDGAGRPQTIRHPNGSETKLTYNHRGQVTKTIVDANGLGETTESFYAANGNLTDVRLPVVSPNYTGFKYLYDDADRVLEIRRGYFSNAAPSNAAFTMIEAVKYEYDQWGNRTSTTYGKNSGSPLYVFVPVTSESAKYDFFNRLSELARPAGDPARKTSFTYDAEGRMSAVLDAQSDQTLYAYDRFGRLGKISQEICEHPASDPNSNCTDSTPAEVTYAYDLARQLTQVAIADSVRSGTLTTTYTTDDFGQVVKVVSPDAGTSTFRYDGAGRLFEMQDARGKKYRFTYDRIGRVTGKVNFTGTPANDVTYCYDGNNFTCGGTDNNTQWAGMLTGVLDKSGVFILEYDKAGRITRRHHGISASPPGIGLPVTYLYDGNGNVKEQGLPKGLRFVYTYDAADRPTAINWCAGTTCSTSFLSNIKWDPFGGPTQWTMTPGFAQNILRDGAGWITETNLRSTADPTSPLKAQDTYSYANDGNVKTRVGFSGTIQTPHDSVSRIKQDESGAYAYDDAGNRITGPGGALTYPSATSNRWSAAEAGALAFTLDAGGNVVTRGGTSLGYADDGLVSSVGTASGTTNYMRDYRNLRVQKAGAGGSGAFTYDEAGRLVHWTGPESTRQCGIKLVTIKGVQQTVPIYENTMPFESFAYIGGIPAAMVKSHITTPCDSTVYPAVAIIDNSYFYYTEKMGIPRGVFRSSDGRLVWDAQFDAFGKPLWMREDPDADGLVFTHALRLPGQQAMTPAEGGPTATIGGLHENWNRVYDSTIGRYLEPDPFQSPKHIAPPYAAFDDSPLAKSDPRGLYTVAAGSCPNLAPALNEAKRRLGGGSSSTVGNCIKCNGCRSRFCECEIDGYLTLGTDPPLHFIPLSVNAHTNCNLFQQSSAHPANSIAIDDSYCTSGWFSNNISGLATVLLHEFTHWCDCQRGSIRALDPDSVGSTSVYDAGVDTERSCAP